LEFFMLGLSSAGCLESSFGNVFGNRFERDIGRKRSRGCDFSSLACSARREGGSGRGERAKGGSEGVGCHGDEKRDMKRTGGTKRIG